MIPVSLRIGNPNVFRSCRLLCTRHASSSANPFPFPTDTNPTPHQIFHLPPSATKDEVKTRYYDLVRIYHPDSAISRAVPPETAHARFQAISAAYSVLTGKVKRMADAESGEPGELRADYNSLSTAMWRARQRRKAELDVGYDERWADALILSTVGLSIGAFVWQTYSARRQAIAEASNWPQRYSRLPRQGASKSTGRPLPDDSILGENPLDASKP